MENEKPAQRERRPLDVFDPRGDGYEPHTLTEIVQRGQEVLDSIDRFREAMYGCTVPINLYSEYWDMRKVREQAESVLEPLRKANDILELDLPLAISAAPGGKLWAPPEGSTSCLSPEEILAVRLRARQVGGDELTTYGRELEKAEKIPSMIRQQRTNRKRAATRAAARNMTDEQRAAAGVRRLQFLEARRARREAAAAREAEEQAVLDADVEALIAAARGGQSSDGQLPKEG